MKGTTFLLGEGTLVLTVRNSDFSLILSAETNWQGCVANFRSRLTAWHRTIPKGCQCYLFNFILILFYFLMKAECAGIFKAAPNKKLKIVSEWKYQGVTMDYHFKFDAHSRKLHKALRTLCDTFLPSIAFWENLKFDKACHSFAKYILMCHF